MLRKLHSLFGPFLGRIDSLWPVDTDAATYKGYQKSVYHGAGDVGNVALLLYRAGARPKASRHWREWAMVSAPLELEARIKNQPT